ncbi:hypothetical protein SK066_03115 [Paenibacillus hunanensis]|uniref:hypothetical protein n=1 Tax=Paenibacillus hunanensis TaxID=539262 RepID=UPI002A6B6F3D|nr:hypothetical protein [Paenibacillus hunanensis]WPP41972.1 hypothetical protein SK066_03115 [Paenibacillus hunanensis]
MHTFRQIRLGEWYGYLIASLGVLVMASLIVAVGYYNGWGFLLVVAIVGFVMYTVFAYFALLKNARTYDYEPHQGFAYYRMPEKTKMVLSWTGFACSVILLFVYCFDASFDRWTFLYGIVIAFLFPGVYYWLKEKTYHDIRTQIACAEILYAYGVLTPDERIYAAYGNISTEAWLALANDQPQSIDWIDYEPNEVQTPLHLLVVTDEELIMCTQHPDEEFMFSTIPLAYIQQLYVSSASYKKVGGESGPKMNKQMIVIGDGEDHQYHFQFSSRLYSGLSLFVSELLACMDDAHLREFDEDELPERDHPDYVPLEDFPMLSSTEEEFLPFSVQPSSV